MTSYHRSQSSQGLAMFSEMSSSDCAQAAKAACAKFKVSKAGGCKVLGTCVKTKANGNVHLFTTFYSILGRTSQNSFYNHMLGVL